MAVPSPRGSSPVFAFVFALGSPRGPGWVRSVIFLRRSSALGRFLSDLWGGIMDLLFSCWPAAQGIGGHCRSPRGHHGPHSTPQQDNKKHFRRVAHDFQVGLDPKPYKFIGSGDMDVTKPYEFIGFGAMDSHTFVFTFSLGNLGPQSPLPDTTFVPCQSIFALHVFTKLGRSIILYYFILYYAILYYTLLYYAILYLDGQVCFGTPRTLSSSAHS